MSLNNPWLEALLNLQECDLHIRRLTERLGMIPLEKKNFQTESKSLADACMTAKQDLAVKENKLKSLESDASAQDAKMQKLLTQSANIRKQDEYNASMLEIENCKRRRSDIETEELETMDAIEAAKKHLDTTLTETKARQEEINEEIAGLDELEKELIAAKEEAQKHRPEFIVPVIPPDVLSHYERLLKRGKGTPLVEVREGICSNCNTSVPLQRVNDSRMGIMAVCDCGHLLYTK